MNMSATDQLIDYAVDLAFEDIPNKTIMDVKIHILDTLGAIAAGSAAPGSGKLAHLVRQWGGRAESTVMVFGDKVPAPNAAMLNAVMSRGFDFETILSGGATHVSASIIPAALAIAEYCEAIKKRPVAGKDFITAVTLGTDLNWRVRVAVAAATIMACGWLAETFSPPAIAALGGKLMGFNRETINYAMGIGFNQCAGTYGATVGENGGLMAQLSQGLGAKTGVLSVLFAEAGFTAYKDVIDGRWVLYAMYGDGKYDADILTGELGRRFAALKPGIKKFPGCGATQPVVASILSLIEKNPIAPGEIKAVDITVGEASYRLCGKDKQEPANPADALWNYRYSAAVALTKADVFVGDFSEEAIRDAKVLALIPKITIHPDKSLGHGVIVTIETKDGQSFTKTLDDMETVPEDEIHKKFKRCCHAAAYPISQERAERLIETVNHLEDMPGISEMVRMLV